MICTTNPARQSSAGSATQSGADALLVALPPPAWLVVGVLHCLSWESQGVAVMTAYRSGVWGEVISPTVTLCTTAVFATVCASAAMLLRA